ncbi:TetR/AcrR family transcriptional regulator [Atopomonas sediminilitoris]|uniref:TetR/AcrR family transcriptional regulator n=1 Tax=Atopomonas sediminilitoris TaxID=2919919 RepID=UPI001F4DF240|nr:TetR/AcrR family transcriptional regulator [Atopomonas sediminilitoris]MCJ8169411.1 TetR/AcrR family transcriptional regulator [Atopomonas sediminilitoris]
MSNPRKPRASSQARIQHILSAARSLLSEHGLTQLSMYTVAERADIPPSSVYHFFPNVAALCQGLTEEVHAAFRACLEAPIDLPAHATWRELARVIEQRMLTVYRQDPAACQLILASHAQADITAADRQHDEQLGQRLYQLFNQRFQLPALDNPVDLFTLALELGDRVYARSVQLHGHITPYYAEEGMRVFEAYLGLYLPVYLVPQSHRSD